MIVKKVSFDTEKNRKLKIQRGITFTEIINAIGMGGLATIINHPNQHRYPNQKIYIVKIKNYVYCVPFIENEEVIYLKTIYPSRKFTKLFMKGENK